MKKLLIGLLLVGATMGVQAQKKVYELGILLDYRNPIVDSLLTQLKREIIGVVGEDALVKFPEEYTLSNGFDLPLAKSQYEYLLEGSVDGILVMGAIGEYALHERKTFSKVTTVLNTYNLGSLPPNIEAENLTYILDKEVLGEDLKAFRKFTPYNRIGIAVEKAYAEILDFTSYLDKVTLELGVEYSLIPFDTPSEIYQQIEEVDAFYLAGGHFMEDHELQDLSEFLMDKKIPSLTVGGTPHLKKGFLATTIPSGSYDQLMRRLALTMSSYLQEIPLPSLPRMLDYESTLTINFNVAEALGLSIPYSSVDAIDFIGDANRLVVDERFTFQTYLKSTLLGNLGFKGNQKDVLIKSQDVKTAKSNYLPTVELASSSEHVSDEFAEISFGQNPEFQSIGSLSLRQTIYSPQASTNIRIEKNLLKIEEFRLSSRELDLVLEASFAYLDALLAKSEVNIQAGNLQLTKTNYKVAKRNFEAGLTGKSDVLRLSSRLAQDKQQMVTAINRLEQALIQLNQFVNNPLSRKIDIEDLGAARGFFHELGYDHFNHLLDNDDSRERFIQFLVEVAKENSPELKTLAFTDKIIDSQMELFGVRRLLPTIGFNANYIKFLDRSGVGSEIEGLAIPHEYYTVGLGVSLPIFSGNRNTISYQKARIEKDQVSLNLSDANLAIETRIRSTVYDVINQMATIKLTRETEENARQALELIQAAYNSGAINVVQLFDVQNTYLQAQIGRIQADYGYLMSLMSLERMISQYSILNSKDENEQLRNRFLTFTR